MERCAARHRDRGMSAAVLCARGKVLERVSGGTPKQGGNKMHGRPWRFVLGDDLRDGNNRGQNRGASSDVASDVGMG